MSAAVPASSAVGALTNLDGYMAAAGYDSEHPWRSEIGAVLSRTDASDIVVSAPYSKVAISAIEVDDQIDMRVKQLAAILHVMPVGRYSPRMVQLAEQLADDLVDAIRSGDDGALLAGQLSELLMMIQGEDSACDLLWLCEQIADEIVALMAATVEEIVAS